MRALSLLLKVLSPVNPPLLHHLPFYDQNQLFIRVLMQEPAKWLSGYLFFLFLDVINKLHKYITYKQKGFELVQAHHYWLRVIVTRPETSIPTSGTYQMFISHPTLRWLPQLHRGVSQYYLLLWNVASSSPISCSN